MLFIIFFGLFSKKDKNIFLVLLSGYILEKLAKVWEDVQKLWKHSPVSSWSHNISSSPKLPFVFLGELELTFA